MKKEKEKLKPLDERILNELLTKEIMESLCRQVQETMSKGGIKPKRRKKRRDCTKCMSYVNCHPEGRCGLDFQPEQVWKPFRGGYKMYVHPHGDACEIVPKPRTKAGFMKSAKKLGVDWDIKDVMSMREVMRRCR